MLDLNITLQRGDFQLEAALSLNETITGLFGPSGSGKSTLLGSIAGLIRPQQGWLKFNGECLFDSQRHLFLPPDQRRIGLVFQESQLFPHFSVRGNLRYGFKRVPQSERQFQFQDIVDLLELGSLLRRRPSTLSGGEKQRVALGRALLASPRLLLLDEPLASLDENLQSQILDFLRRIKQEFRIPMIYVSHVLEEILQLTDQLAVIHQGRILGHGPLFEISQKKLLGQTIPTAPPFSSWRDGHREAEFASEYPPEALPR